MAKQNLTELSDGDLLELLDADDDAVLDRVGRWYIPNREVRYVRRNALVALGNTDDGHDGIDAALARYAASDDAMLAEHAAWAQRRRVARP